MSPLTGVLSEAWGLYRRFAAHFLAISFVIYLVAAAIIALLTAVAGVVGLLVGVVITLIAQFLLQAALVKAVQDVRDGRVDLDFGQTLSAAAPFIAPVAAASILAAIPIVIGFFLLIVPGVILLTYWLLIVPAIVVGGAGVMDSFGASYRLVKGHWWQVFGTYVLAVLILFAGELVLGAILLFLPYAVRNFISNVVIGTLAAPFMALVVTLIYYRLTGADAGPVPAGGGYAPPATGVTAPPPDAATGGGYGQPSPEPPAGGGSPQPPPAQPPDWDATQT
jgi:hypothetical protein